MPQREVVQGKERHVCSDTQAKQLETQGGAAGEVRECGECKTAICKCEQVHHGVIEVDVGSGPASSTSES